MVSHTLHEQSEQMVAVCRAALVSSWHLLQQLIQRNLKRSYGLKKGKPRAFDAEKTQQLDSSRELNQIESVVQILILMFDAEGC